MAERVYSASEYAHIGGLACVGCGRPFVEGEPLHESLWGMGTVGDLVHVPGVDATHDEPLAFVYVVCGACAVDGRVIPNVRPVARRLQEEADGG